MKSSNFKFEKLFHLSECSYCKKESSQKEKKIFDFQLLVILWGQEHEFEILMLPTFTIDISNFLIYMFYKSEVFTQCL